MLSFTKIWCVFTLKTIEKVFSETPGLNDALYSQTNFPVGIQETRHYRHEVQHNWLKNKHEYMHLNTSWVVSHRWSCLAVPYDSANHSVQDTKLNSFGWLLYHIVLQESLILVELMVPLRTWVRLTKLSNWFPLSPHLQTLLISYGTMHQTACGWFSLSKRTKPPS